MPTPRVTLPAPHSPLSLWRRILIRIGRDPSRLHRRDEIGPPDARPIPSPLSWSERVDPESDLGAAEMFPDYLAGDETWADHLRVIGKRLPDGTVPVEYAHCQLRLVRDGATISRRMRWLT